MSALRLYGRVYVSWRGCGVRGGYQPRLRHQVLDLRTLARQPQTMAEPNLVAWIWGIGEEVLEEVKSLKEAGMIYAGAPPWSAGRRG